MKVVKRNGVVEDFNKEKILEAINYCCEGLEGVEAKAVYMNARIRLFDGISTAEIHDTVIHSARDMITDLQPNYALVAGRLELMKIRKDAFNSYTPPNLLDHISKMCEIGVYHKEIIEKWSHRDIEYFDRRIDHTADETYGYAAMSVYREKYLMQNRVTKKVYESPQIALMLMSMCFFQDYPKSTRKQYVIRFYNALKDMKLSLPTPIMGGLRSPMKQFSSCFPAGQKVYSREGLVNIQDVKEGDYVLTKGGTYEKVLLNSKKVSDADSFVSLRTQFSIPWDFESTSDHRIMAIKKYHHDSRKKYSVPEWVEAKNLQVGDFVKIPYNSHILNVDHIDVPVPEGYIVTNGFIRKQTTDPSKRSGDFDDKVRPVPHKIPLTGHFMRVLGYFLAEGHVNKNCNSIGFTFNANEENYHKDVIEYFENLGLHCSVHNTNKNATSITISSLAIKELFLYLVGTGFDKKTISDVIMRVDPSLQKELLIGVIRGDGCIHKNGMVLGMCNRTLVHQLALLCLRNGLYPSLGYRKTKETDGSYSISEVYILNLSKGPNLDFLKTVGKSQDKLNETSLKGYEYGLAKYLNGDYYAKVLEIRGRPNGGEVVYDLSIDNDHSFTVSGVGVHNCVLVEVGDSLSSINAANNAIVRYVSQRAGIGINGGRIRALGSAVRDGLAFHTGCLPFWKTFQATLKSCSQGGIRSGAGTLFYPVWHKEVESFLVLKNNKGTEDNRIRHMDYGVQMNGWFLRKALEPESKMNLFCPNDVPDMYEAFFANQDEFERLYEKYSADPNIKKKTVKTMDILQTFVQERSSTGRVYPMFVDNVNNHGPFNPEKAPVRQSNLC